MTATEKKSAGKPLDRMFVGKRVHVITLGDHSFEGTVTDSNSLRVDPLPIHEVWLEIDGHGWVNMNHVVYASWPEG